MPTRNYRLSARGTPTRAGVTAGSPPAGRRRRPMHGIKELLGAPTKQALLPPPHYNVFLHLQHCFSSTSRVGS